jgi:serine/threonine protein kinase
MRSDEVYRRLAALKVIRPELRSDPLQDRFLQEREILARLDHPNIARIIDGGTTPDGLPYFVMDYVDGQPLDEYCKAKRATMEQRLALFQQTCAAVQYLHDNGVLHRDLKPANILVTHTGQVKLLDFGVSKLVGPTVEGEIRSNVTTGMPIVTAGYASPEQITSKPVTEAADIYSLGVVLYELLTGVRPLKLDGKSLPEILTVITQQMPAKPSTQAPLPEDADPGRLLTEMRPKLAGDLDSILMMALRKEPERRYISVKQFAADLDSFTQGRPVRARGDGTAYVISRSLRRNRLRVAALLVMAVSLAGGGWAVQRALDERSQIESLQVEVVEMKARLAQAQAEHAPNAKAQLQSDLTHLSADYDAKTAAVLNSRLAPKMLTRQLAQQSLSYFSEAQAVAGDDPEVVAALGKAYLAVAQSQWNPERGSLNDPAEAAKTCAAALKVLEASPQLSQNPEVQQVFRRVSDLLEQDPATHQLVN